MDNSTFRILIHPNETLRKKFLDEIHFVEDQHRADAEKMLRTMEKAKGVGLSSPQVGLTYQLIVMNHDGKTPRVMFNPFIVKRSAKKITMGEGCLSFPRLHKMVSRPDSVIVRFRDSQNVVKLESFDGLEARIIMHEVDHLNGILFTDR